MNFSAFLSQPIVIETALLMAIAVLLIVLVLGFISPLRKINVELKKKLKALKDEQEKLSAELNKTRKNLNETGKMLTIGNLGAGIIHQLSQPLTAIHGAAGLLRSQMSASGSVNEAVVLIDEQSGYLKEMLDDLLVLIRHRKVHKENIDANEIIKKSLKLLKDELRIARVDWRLDLDLDIPEIEGDKVQLQQVFMNIVINAIQAMKINAQGLTRQMKIESYHDKIREEVVLKFFNNGPSMTIRQRQEVFEPFYTTKQDGSGIGLALCNNIIREHHGSISIDSKERVGTTFIIRLPILGVDEHIAHS